MPVAYLVCSVMLSLDRLHIFVVVYDVLFPFDFVVFDLLTAQC
jgi:hypothetical protein